MLKYVNLRNSKILTIIILTSNIYIYEWLKIMKSMCNQMGLRKIMKPKNLSLNSTKK